MSKLTEVTITKEDIIEALETEPLTYEYFIDKPNCRVCAVGSVVRSLFKQAKRDERADEQLFDDIASEITENNISATSIANRGNYMSALSIVWEALNFDEYRHNSILSTLTDLHHKVEGPKEQDLFNELLTIYRDKQVETLRPYIVQWAEDNIPEDYELTGAL